MPTLKSKKINLSRSCAESHRIIRKVVKGILEDKKLLVRPRQRWSDRVEKDVSLLGTDIGEEAVYDTGGWWEEVAVVVKDPNGELSR